MQHVWTCLGRKPRIPQNTRGMMAFLMEIHTFGPLVKNKALQIVTDNISAMADINHMGGQSHSLTIITKAIDTTSISYQPLCCGRESKNMSNGREPMT